MASPQLLQELVSLKTDLGEIEKSLDECEKKGSKRALADAALKMKNVAPKLKAVKADPSSSVPEVAKLIADINNGFKVQFQRAKTLKEASEKAAAAAAAQPPPAAAAPAATLAAPAQPPKSSTPTITPSAPKEAAAKSTPSPAPSTSPANVVVPEPVKATPKVDKTPSPQPAKSPAAAPVQAPQPSAAELEAERKKEEQEKDRERKKELQETLAQQGDQKRAADVAAREAQKKHDRAEALANQAKQVSSADDDDGADGGGKGLSLALPGMKEAKAGKDIWSLVIKRREEQRKKEAAEAQSDEYTVIFVGGKSAGKSTLLAGFLDKRPESQASTALEYSFGRRTRGSTVSREVVHCWEIAGGTRLAPLLEVCLTPERIGTTAVVIAIDLSDPSRMMETLMVWLDAIRARAESCFKSLSKTDPAKREAISAAWAASYPQGHADKASVRPLGVPALLVGTKYDLFQDLEAEQRKVVSRTLRFMAHLNAMSVIYMVAKDEGKHLTRFRAHLNNCLFNSPVPEGAVTAYTKPLVVPRGQDTFEAIGKPSGEGPGAGGSIANALAWKEMFNRVFPPKEAEDAEHGPTDDSDKYRETVVDAIVAEKEQEFARSQHLLNDVNAMLAT